MRLPDRVAYREALHAPRIAFPDPPLRDGRPRINLQHQPVAASGAFAITFDVQVGAAHYAVRCFTQHGDHLQQRYAAVADFVRSSGSRFLVDVNYLPAGIRVDGQTWPVVMMPWIDGSCLNDWIDDNLTNPAALERVRRNIDAAVTSLRQRQVAHGDLQHGNIMVGRDGSIQLIDYDGMYLPALAGYGAAESGHRNYQHPERGDRFDASLDAFAAYVVDLSISAVATQQDLWTRFNHGDNLIFRAQDFTDPDNADVFDALARIPTLTERAERLRLACLAPFAQVPDVLSGAVKPTAGRVRAPVSPLAGTPRIFDAIERADLLTHDGEEATVVGRIVSVKTLSGRRGGTYSLVNFGDHRQGTFTVVLWDKTRRAVVRNLGEPEALIGSYVQVTGHLSSFQGAKGPLTPQIDLRHARSLQPITASQATVLLAQAAAGKKAARTPRASPQTTPAQQSAPPRPTAPAPAASAVPADASRLEDRLAKLYGSSGFARKVTPSTAPTPPPAAPRTTARFAATTPTPPRPPAPPRASAQSGASARANSSTWPPPWSPTAGNAAPPPPPQATPSANHPPGSRPPVHPQVHSFIGSGPRLPRSMPASLRRLPYLGTRTAETWLQISLLGAGGTFFILLMSCMYGAVAPLIALLMTPVAGLLAVIGIIYGIAAVLIPPPDPAAKTRVQSMGALGTLISAFFLVIALVMALGMVVT